MGQKHRVLIVDDCREIVAALEAFFKRKYKVFTAYDGLEGLQTFEQNEDCIDLVISDLQMPNLDGTELISILKKKYPGVPVIAITGWRGNMETSGTILNADRVFEKPFNILDLDNSVEMLLSRKDMSPFLETAGH